MAYGIDPLSNPEWDGSFTGFVPFWFKLVYVSSMKSPARDWSKPGILRRDHSKQLRIRHALGAKELRRIYQTAEAKAQQVHDQYVDSEIARLIAPCGCCPAVPPKSG